MQKRDGDMEQLWGMGMGGRYVESGMKEERDSIVQMSEEQEETDVQGR